MGKFRSKLKRHTKGKTWSKGHSSTSNPDQMKHRIKAKSRFFRPNLSLAPTEGEPNRNTLTLEAVMKHEQRQAFKADTTTVNEVAGSLKSFTLHDDDELMSESQGGTFKTFKTFASNYSTCSNMSFKKLLVGFRASSDLHKEMLAILTALTEIIKERGGTESSTEYFILLMEQIEASTEDNDIIAGVSLLSMGIKSVPTAVLRKLFSKTAQTLMSCLKRFIESNNMAIIKYIIGSLSVLLRAQDYLTWTYSSSWQYIDTLLGFTIHSKPKIRKAAQHAVVSIILGSSFMLSQKFPNDEEADDDIDQPMDSCNQQPKIKFHPASSRVTKFCLNQFKPEVLAQQQTTVLHTLALLKETISGLKTDDIRTVCECLFSIMTAANVLIRTNCLQTLNQLFLSRTTNLNGSLCAKLLAATQEYRPNRADYRQTLAWLTVLKEGHIHLCQLDMKLCMNALPSFIDICCSDLWLSDRTDIIAGVSNAIKELLYECVKPACLTLEQANIYRLPIVKILSLVHKVLSAPFGEVAKYVVLIFSIIFEVCGQHFAKELAASVLELAKRYDPDSPLRFQIEHAVISSIKSMGPEIVLKSIPLTNVKGEVLLEKSWLLPLLKEGIAGSSFKYFKEVILPLIMHCEEKWRTYTDEKQVSMSITYDLLCGQLWALLPSFCRNPKDPENFKLIAETLGKNLKDNTKSGESILNGLIELIKNEEQTIMHEVLGRRAKNFLPILFDIYKQKTNSEQNLRKKSLEVIKLYLTKTPKDKIQELFSSTYKNLKVNAVGSFEYDSTFDIVAALVLFQTSVLIRSFFKTYIIPVLKNEKSKCVAKDAQKLKKQQRKTYELLRDILTSESASCKKFTNSNLIALEKLLLEAFSTSCTVCQAARLRCLQILIKKRKPITINDEIINKTLPEAVINYKEFSTRKENISEELLKLISDLYQEAGKLNDLIDILTVGFTGDESLITNTILAFRTVVQIQGNHLTVSTLEFIMEQIAVFLVQKSRSQAEASVAFLITFIKVMPAPLVANHLETIMKALSAMVKDTKRYCRIQIGFLLKKLCKRFTAEVLIKYVPGDDEVTHRRLKKVRKQLRRDNRKKQSEGNSKDSDEDNSDEEFVPGLEKKSMTIDDILADSDSDLPEEMDEDKKGSKSKGKKQRSTFIREDPEEIVDLADIKSISNVLTNRPSAERSTAGLKTKSKDPNRGFKTAEDGRLIISENAFGKDDDDSSSTEDDDEGVKIIEKKSVKRGMEDDSSEEEDMAVSVANHKRKATDTLSIRSGKTSASRYTTGGKGIHRNVDSAWDAVSMKSGKSSYSTKSKQSGTEYSTKKAKGDIKKKGKLDPYAYIPLSRNTLNRRKRAKHAGKFKNIVNGARKGALKGVKNKIVKAYKK